LPATPPPKTAGIVPVTSISISPLPLTVHGLWPNRKKVSVNKQPQSCSREKLADFPAELREQLEIYMPGIADGLQKHEWTKHGVCSGLSSDDYFHVIVEFAQRANETIGAVIKERGLLGQTVGVQDLLDAVAQKNGALANAIVISCASPRKQRGGRGANGAPRALVSEIRVMITKDIAADPDGDGWPGRFVPLRELGFRANSGCPGGAGFLPAGYGD
jgi:ribonuclease T2